LRFISGSRLAVNRTLPLTNPTRGFFFPFFFFLLRSVRFAIRRSTLWSIEGIQSIVPLQRFVVDLLLRKIKFRKLAVREHESPEKCIPRCSQDVPVPSWKDSVIVRSVRPLRGSVGGPRSSLGRAEKRGRARVPSCFFIVYDFGFRGSRGGASPAVVRRRVSPRRRPLARARFATPVSATSSALSRETTAHRYGHDLGRARA